MEIHECWFFSEGGEKAMGQKLWINKEKIDRKQSEEKRSTLIEIGSVQCCQMK
jgi:hypothetical protein